MSNSRVFTNFKSALALSEQELIKNPFVFAYLKHKKFRRILLEGFPYKLIYCIDLVNKEVQIFAFFHTARSNKFIKKRLSPN